MYKTIKLFIAILVAFAIFPAYSRAADNHQNRFIVTFLGTGKTTKQEANFIKNNKKNIIKKFAFTHSYVSRLSAAQSKELNKNHAILVEKDIKVKMNGFNPVNKNWGANRIGAPLSNFGGLTGKGVKIGVIDTGIQRDNPQIKVYGGYNFLSNNNFYGDNNGHGTHVAGIIAGEPGANGFSGIAPDAQLYALKVLNSFGEGYASDIIAAINWSIQNKMDIINLSLGQSEPLVALEEAVNRAYENGLLVVAAAGNEGGTNTVEYPAKYPAVISVGAVTAQDELAKYSSSGKEIEVTAPGDNILSTYIGGQFAYLSGTSMATPHVVGVLALYKQKFPQYSNIQLRSLLDKNVVDLGPVGRDSSFGFGLVKAPLSITFSSRNTITRFLGTRTSANEIRLIWSSHVNQTYIIERDGVQIYKGKLKTFIDHNAPDVRTYQYTLLSSSRSEREVSVGD
ncbi:S8 family peptidase [Neobacillus sp. PS3-40]|uniref:S8 family peptidase n=1 Tax=Neobacillus sp. PS3-40 TaxID=3070679 RepID=UPI0027E14910|nr:S8 family peptidase [Neobacillus sp. PS3-40]WML46096.1 S8 family peptidase [Neobacillus sp. PS3-40]